MPFLPSFTTMQLFISAVLLLIGIGVALTLITGVMRGCLAVMSLSSRLLARLWHWLTGVRPSSWGTAHLATMAEIDAKGLFTPGGITLATWDGKPLYAPVGSHIAVVAPPRSWKSTSFLAPAIAAYEGACLINDPRAELFSMTHVARAAKGAVYQFSPTQKLSCQLNILDAVRWDQDEAHGDVQRIIWTLTSPAPGEVITPFMQEAQPLLEGIAWDRHTEGEGSLPAMLEWMLEPSTPMKQKMQSLVSSPLPVVRGAARRFLDKSERLQASVWSSALSTLSLYGDPLVAEHTRRSDVALSDLQHSARPITLYLSPPFADVARLRPLLAALTEQLCALFSVQQDQPRNRVALFLDEAANLGRLEGLERGLSYLQGCSVAAVMCWQNLPQIEHTYGRGTPLLASVGVRLFYTPNDHVTAEAISDEMGSTTVRLHPESQTRSALGLLNSTTIGSSEHVRPLYTSDEVRRLDESAAVIFLKGLAPVMARKLGSAAPVVLDLTSRPMLKRVAMLAGAFLVAGSLTTWALWPTPQTTPPRLAMTTETPRPTGQPPYQPPREDGGTGAQAPGMPSDPTPERFTLNWSDRLTINTPKPWGLYLTIEPPPLGKGPYTTKNQGGGSFETQADCEAELAHKLQGIARMIATQRPGAAILSHVPHGYTQRFGPKSSTTHTWACLLDQPPPS